jgi:phosphomethylpyrimidine synthase
MKITEDVRRYAEEKGISENDAIKHGLQEKAEEFKRTGTEMYTSEISNK